MKRFPLLILILTCIAVLAAPRRNGALEAQQNLRKADYLYLEALCQEEKDNTDAAFELLTRAHELAPEDLDIGQRLSIYRLQLSSEDTTMLSKSLAMQKRYIDANPEDVFAAVRYALIVEQLGDNEEALATWRALHHREPARREITFRYVQSLIAGGDAGKETALAVLDTIAAMEGPSIDVASRKVAVHAVAGDTLAALAVVRDLYSTMPKSVDFNVYAGEIYAAFGRPDSAIIFYDRACELDPSSGLAYFSRAQFFNQQGDSAAFNREIFQALEKRDLDVTNKLVMLRSYVQEMYTDSTQQPAIHRLFEVLIEQHPHEHDIHELYAQYLLSQKAYAGAATQMELALDADPGEQEEWELLTSLYLQTDDYKKAHQATSRSLRYFPRNARQYFLLGTLQQMEGDTLKAPVSYDKALQYADSTDLQLISQIYCAIADNLYARHQSEKAYDYYKKTLLYNPDNTLALNNCAYFMACEGIDLDRALAMIEKAVKADSENTSYLDTYAWVLYKLKNYERAREEIDRTMQTMQEQGEPLSAEVLDHAGDIYLRCGEPERAVEFWEEALKLSPDDPDLTRKVKMKHGL